MAITPVVPQREEPQGTTAQGTASQDTTAQGTASQNVSGTVNDF